MPRPHVPPDPDLPSPLHWEAADSLTAAPLVLRGMEPHAEQYLHDFWVDGRAAGVMLLSLQNATEHTYAGVLVHDLAGSNGNPVLKMRYRPDDKYRSASFKLQSTDWRSEVIAATASPAVGGKVSLHVSVKGPLWGARYVVAVPMDNPRGKFDRFETYLQQAAWVKVAGGTQSAELGVVPHGQSRYGVFVAAGVPDALKIESAAYPVTLI